jgi:carboxyl-terminal processing protease
LQDLDRQLLWAAEALGKTKPIDLTYNTIKSDYFRYYTLQEDVYALDYAHKDKNGIAVRTEEKIITHSKHARTVYDGGGILPDLQLEESKLSTIANALIKMTAYSIMQQTIIIKPYLGNQTPTSRMRIIKISNNI